MSAVGGAGGRGAGGAGGAAPLNPLSGLAPALASFRTRLDGTSRALTSLTSALRAAAGRVDSLAAPTRQARSAVTRFRTRADAGARAAGAVARTAKTAGSRLRRFTAAVRRGRHTMGRLAVGAGGFVSLLLGEVTIGGTLGKILTVFGTAATLYGIVMTAVNTTMKANPWGFILSLLVPVVGYLIDLAVNSETGQRVIQQVLTLALTYVKTVLTVLQPVLKTVATLVGTYFTAYLAVITAVLTVLTALVSGDFSHVRSSLNGALAPLRAIVSQSLGRVRSVLGGVLHWFTGTLPRGFDRVRGALSGALHGIGRFLTAGAQSVLSVVKGPIRGMIAFANWVISGLNTIHFSIFGKGFGIHLKRLPQLAEGGVVSPVAPGGSPAGAVRPLSSLERLRAAEMPRAAEAAAPSAAPRLRVYRAAHGHSAMTVAQDLLFLRRAAAAAGPAPTAAA